MKKLFYILLLLTNFCNAQTLKKPVGVFNVAEIKFWQTELASQFKSLKLTVTEDEGIFSSSRIPNSFEKCYFLKDESKQGYSIVKASREFKTNKEAINFITGIKKYLDECLKPQKFNIDNLEDNQSIYTKSDSKKLGNTKFDIYIDPQSEIINDKLTDNIVGYAVKLIMEFRKVIPNDDIIEEEPLKKEAPKQTANKLKTKLDCIEIDFWETKLFENFKDMDVENLGDGKYLSTKVVSGFDILYFYMRPHEFRTPRFSTRKENIKTYAEALTFYNAINAQLKKCLTQKKYKPIAVTNDGLDKKYLTYSYIKKFGNLGDILTVYISLRSNNSDKPDENSYYVTLDFERSVE